MEEYDIIVIKGKHGMIKLHVPKKAATEEDINNLHRTIAEVVVNSRKQYNKEEKAAKQQ